MPDKTTPLYQEALLEVKKLRELAKKEAEKSILEKFSPIVDQIINKEMSGVPVILEQEEDPTALPPTGTTPAPTIPDPGVATTTPSQMPATAPMDANVTPPTSDTGTSPPTTVDSGVTPVTEPSLPLPADATTAPITSGASLAIPIPGPDGKITVDIEALFAATPEGSEPNFANAAITPAPAAEVPPKIEGEPMSTPDLSDEPKTTPPTPEIQSVPLVEFFKGSLDSLEEEVLNELNSTKKLSISKKEILQNKIVSLYEMAQKAKISKEIPRAIIANGEVLMDLMFAKLEESAKQDNSYNRQTTKEDLKMAKKDFKTLKEFAVSLFAEEVETKGHAGFGDGDTAKTGIKNTTTLKDETPKKKSGSAGGVKDPGKEESLKIGGAAVAESAEDNDAEVMDEAATLESELMEMLANMEEEGMTAMSVPEEDENLMMEYNDDEEENAVKKESLHKKLRALKEEEAKLAKALKECGMSGATVAEPANVNIKISVEGGEIEDIDTGEETEANDDEMIEIVPDSEESEGEEEEEEMLGSHDEEDLEDESSEESSEEDEEEKEDRVPMVTESKVSKENKKLRSQLAETQLLTARSLFVSKLFAEHNLSVGTKQRIVEYIDSAQTVEEAKTKYGRVKKMLEESRKPVRKVGSSSKPSALSTSVLAENTNPLMKLEMNPNRWMHLAGIKK